MKTRLFLFLLITTMSISCNSDKDSDKPSIVGNWTEYKTIYEDGEYFCETEYCKKYEFNTNGTCKFIEDNIYIETYSYKIEGDFIRFFITGTDFLEDTVRIVSLTNDEMQLVSCEDCREVLVYKRDK